MSKVRATITQERHAELTQQIRQDVAFLGGNMAAISRDVLHCAPNAGRGRGLPCGMEGCG